MITLDRILVPLDGSVLSEAVLPVAETLARDYDAELLLLRAVVAEDAEGYLRGIADELRGRGVKRLRWTVWYGPAEQAIVETAAGNRVDLIAMTTHGRGGLGRLFLGSVAENIVRRASAPVLLVRGQPSWRPGEIPGILVPLDGSELSAAILPVVERLAGPFDLSVILLHALEPIAPSALAEASPRQEEVAELRRVEAEAYLSKLAGALQGKGLRVRHEVRAGRAVDVIPQYTREAGIGLIAMTTHGRTGLGRLFFGSVAERVVRSVTVPVILWRPREESP